jgi:hypothetical protein
VLCVDVIRDELLDVTDHPIWPDLACDTDARTRAGAIAARAEQPAALEANR